jgi:integrase
LRARKTKGSVVYNKSRATWNYLFTESGKRKSRKLGTLSDLPTKADAIRKAEVVNREMRLVAQRLVPTVNQLVEGYKAERMPKRYSTNRSYKSWLDNYILPRWGASPITNLKPRPVEQWLDSLELSPRSKGFIRSLVHAIWDYAMWSDTVPTQANPARLVRVPDVSKRKRQPHPLTMSAFQTFVKHLGEPFRTIACVSVCFGLRISECLALRWGDINWLEGKLSIQRSIVRQRVGDVKTAYSKKTMPIDSEMLQVLESWRTRTQFSSDDDWVFASPVQFGRLPWSADGVNDAYRKAASIAGIGHVSTHTMRHTYRSWLDAVGTSIAVQQKLMRHADIRTTMNVYGDVVTNEMELAHSKVVRMALAPVN